MHICCSTCSLYPLQALAARDIDVTGFWYNPNIHPYTEYAMRIESVRQLEQMRNLEIEYNDCYGLKEFLRAVLHDEENRCSACYAMRLESTAVAAKRMKLDAFTTTLLVSPYQMFDTIVRVGIETGEKHGVPFYAEDFRPGWADTLKKSGELGLYRQKYCGCIYSEMERYQKKNRRKDILTT